MSWPQYTWLALCVLRIGIALAKDGEPKTGRYSFLTTILASGIIGWILYCGGFFG